VDVNTEAIAPLVSTTTTQLDALLRHGACRPRAPAYIDSLGVLDYGTLCAAARRGATWLHGQGVRAGDTVALAMDASPAGARRALELFYAAAWLGAAVLPLYPDVPQLARIGLIARLHPAWLLASGAPPWVERARALDPTAFDPADETLDGRPAPRGDTPDAPFYFLFTSGTTGNAKALLASHRKMALNWQSYAQILPVATDDRELSSVPWPSVVGQRNMLRVHYGGGAYVRSTLGENLDEFGAVLRRYGVTRVLALAPQMRGLLATPAPAEPLPALRSFNVVGSEISAAEIAAARAGLTPNFEADYGSNEVGYISKLAPGDTATVAGDVGPLIDGVQVRVEDEEGALLPPGAVGRLGFRTPWMYDGYADQPEASAAQFRNGWFYSGDVGGLTAEGRLFLRGRSDDVINIGGMKLWPAEVEEVIREHPAVLDVAVTGVPHPRAGQIPIAFVVARRAVYLRVSEQQLIEFCAVRLTLASIPRLFFFVPAVPRNVNGKLLREKLLAAYPYAAEMALKL
jgi:acyl-CoA synthetase (AMP-forming)/AMP-acid ligase II